MRTASTGRSIVVTILAATLLGLLSSTPRGEVQAAEDGTAEPAAGPVLVVGVDGLEWNIILAMLRQDRLPNLRRLMQLGVFGHLETLEPTLSPVIWTSIATGKVHGKHGIDHFSKPSADGGLKLYDSIDRKTKALWNILTDYGRTIDVIGWWMTYPVEPIRGVMVAQTNTKAQLDVTAGKHVWKGTLIKGVPEQVHPVERQNEMISILEQVQGELPRLTREIFGEFSRPLSRLEERLWSNCLWSFRADETYFRIALHLAERKPLRDLTMLYLGGPDVVGHRFWRYMEPALYRHQPTPEQITDLGDVIEDYYSHVDAMLGRLLAAYGTGATFLVVSDHGMRPENQDADFDPEDPPADVRSGAHTSAPAGVFIAAGPPIRQMVKDGRASLPGREPGGTVGSVLDIAPTLLAMLRLPIGRDMDGEPMKWIFKDEFLIDRQPAAIATHDDAEFLRSRRREPGLTPGEKERLEQLRALGYIGGDG